MRALVRDSCLTVLITQLACAAVTWLVPGAR
jgi:hypothetical protein